VTQRYSETHDWDNDGELILTGSANAYVAATARQITGYYQGLRICGRANHTNTGAATLNVNGIGAAAIRKLTSVALVPGDMASGQYYDFIYDFANGWFQMLSPSSASSVGGMPLSASGDRWGVVPFVHTDGVMEVGRYIDFHNSDADTTDFAMRLDSVSSALGLSQSLAGGSPALLATVGRQTKWIPAIEMNIRTAGGGAGSPIRATFVIVSAVLECLAYDAAALEDAYYSWAMPKSWDEGQISVQFYWSHPATVTNFDVLWNVFAVAYGNDDAIDGTSFLGSGNIVDTGGTTGDLYISPESSPFTIGNGVAEGDLVHFLIRRNATDAADTLAVDAFLFGMKIFYNTNLPNDA
jgi:hypothetical protein